MDQKGSTSAIQNLKAASKYVCFGHNYSCCF